jgi:hypothetical protein
MFMRITCLNGKCLTTTEKRRQAHADRSQAQADLDRVRAIKRAAALSTKTSDDTIAANVATGRRWQRSAA